MRTKLGELKPGAIEVSQPGKAIYLGIGVWAKKNDAGRIHIHITGGERFHITVTNQRESARYHRVLFRNLRRRLVENGAWPFGQEGSETESRD
jgi:hypothetical protein